MDLVFWQTVDASTVWASVGVFVGLLLCFWLAIRLRNHWEQTSNFREFSHKAHLLGIDEEERADLQALVHHQAVRRPVRLLNSLREYDNLVTQEILRLLESPQSWSAKIRSIDRFYSVRDKILRQETPGEHTALFARRSSRVSPVAE